jgi:hypothetical protein
MKNKSKIKEWNDDDKLIITQINWKISLSQDSICFPLSWCYSLESTNKVRKENKKKYAAYH